MLPLTSTGAANAAIGVTYAHEPPLPDPWRYIRYMAYCVCAAVLLAVYIAICIASAPRLMRIFYPSSDSTIVFDTGGKTTRYEKPLHQLLLRVQLLPLVSCASSFSSPSAPPQ